jgi:hypothetical protein
MQDVDPAEGGKAGINHGFHIAALCHVAGKGEASPALGGDHRVRFPGRRRL